MISSAVCNMYFTVMNCLLQRFSLHHYRNLVVMFVFSSRLCLEFSEFTDLQALFSKTFGHYFFKFFCMCVRGYRHVEARGIFPQALSTLLCKTGSYYVALAGLKLTM